MKSALPYYAFAEVIKVEVHWTPIDFATSSSTLTYRDVQHALTGNFAENFAYLDNVNGVVNTPFL